MRPRSCSKSPWTCSRSSSVSFPHCLRTEPLSSFHLPLNVSRFIPTSRAGVSPPSRSRRIDLAAPGASLAPLALDELLEALEIASDAIADDADDVAGIFDEAFRIV